MFVFCIIMGLLMVGGGAACMASPVATYFQTGYVVGAMVLAYGIVGFVRAFNGLAHPLEGIVSLAAIILGTAFFFRPGTVEAFDAVMLYVLAGWTCAQGLFEAIVAVRTRDVRRYWVLGLLSGLLGIALGVYTFVHPMVAAITLGWLIGLYFIEDGVSLITLALTAKKVRDELLG